MTYLKKAALAATIFCACSSPMTAQAQTVTMTGTIVNLCILTIATPGLLGISGAGTELSTTQQGGSAATLTVIAAGTHPTITFSTPGISGPSSGGAVAEFAYSSTGGASRTYGTGNYVYAMNRLLDTVTINGRATNNGGFASGLYTMSATATCAQ